jgi:molybdate transport system substrate-binding protein
VRRFHAIICDGTNNDKSHVIHDSSRRAAPAARDIVNLTEHEYQCAVAGPLLRRAAPLVLALLACGSCARPPAPSRRVTVAAASDLRFALDEVTAAFERARPGVEVRASYGSSGSFYAQIRNGAPFDAFLSADIEYPRRLREAGLGLPDSLFTYGVGRIVLWVRAQSKLDPAAALRDPAVRRFAIANPAHAPYGRAAEAALRSLGVYNELKTKLVLGEDISQTFGFIENGAADAGIVALSLALTPVARAEGRYWEIPSDAYPRIDQAGLLLKDSPDSRAFFDFLRGTGGRAILKKYGFSPPEEH